MKDKIIIGTGILLLFLLTVFNIPFLANISDSKLIQDIIIRAIGASLFIYMIYTKGLKSYISFGKIDSKLLLITIPAFLIAINNFPFSAYISGRAEITGSISSIIIFALFIISVGVFEEIVFRGVVLNLFIQKSQKTKTGVFLAIVYSSLVFSLLHLLNVFAGSGFLPILLQIGYTFLIGMMFAVVYLKTKNIWTTIVIHTIYNIGGLMFSTIGTIYDQWDTVTIVTTSLLALFTIRFYFLEFSKMDIANIE